MTDVIEIVPETFLSNLVSLGGSFPCSVHFLQHGKKKQVESCTHLPSPQGNIVSFIITFSGSDASYHLVIALHVETSSKHGAPSSLVPSNHGAEVLMAADHSTRDVPAFQIVGSSIEFYLRCMVCNPNGFQFVLAYEFEACPTPFRGSSSAPFSVYSRMENHDFIATTVGELSYPESITLIKDNQYSIKVHHFTPNLIFLIGPYRLPVIYENQKEEYVIVKIPQNPCNLFEEFVKLSAMEEGDESGVLSARKEFKFVLSVVSKSSFLSYGPHKIMFAFKNSIANLFFTCGQIVGSDFSDPLKWQTEDIVRWVKSSRFAKFESCFQWVGDGEALFELTAADLITMGVDAPASVPFIQEIRRLKNANSQGSIITAIGTEDPSLSKALKSCTTFDSILAKNEEVKTLKSIFLQILRRIGEKTNKFTAVDHALLKILAEDIVCLQWLNETDDILPFDAFEYQVVFHIFAKAVESGDVPFFPRYTKFRKSADFPRRPTRTVEATLSIPNLSLQANTNATRAPPSSQVIVSIPLSPQSATSPVSPQSRSIQEKPPSFHKGPLVIDKKPSVVIEKKSPAPAPVEKSASYGSRGVIAYRPDRAKPGTVERIVQQFETNDFSAREVEMEQARNPNPILYDTLWELVSDESTDDGKHRAPSYIGEEHLFTDNANVSRAEGKETDDETVVRHALLMHCKSLKGLPSIVPDSENYSVSLENMMLETTIPDFKEPIVIEPEPEVIELPPSLLPPEQPAQQVNSLSQQDPTSLPQRQHPEDERSEGEKSIDPDDRPQRSVPSLPDQPSTSPASGTVPRPESPVTSQPAQQPEAIAVESERETLASFLAEQLQLHGLHSSSLSSSNSDVPQALKSSGDRALPVPQAGTKQRVPSGLANQSVVNVENSTTADLAKPSEPQPSKKQVVKRPQSTNVGRKGVPVSYNQPRGETSSTDSTKDTTASSRPESANSALPVPVENPAWNLVEASSSARSSEGAAEREKELLQKERFSSSADVIDATQNEPASGSGAVFVARDRMRVASAEEAPEKVEDEANKEAPKRGRAGVPSRPVSSKPGPTRTFTYKTQDGDAANRAALVAAIEEAERAKTSPTSNVVSDGATVHSSGSLPSSPHVVTHAKADAPVEKSDASARETVAPSELKSPGETKPAETLASASASSPNSPKLERIDSGKKSATRGSTPTRDKIGAPSTAKPRAGTPNSRPESKAARGEGAKTLDKIPDNQKTNASAEKLNVVTTPKEKESTHSEGPSATSGTATPTVTSTPSSPRKKDEARPSSADGATVAKTSSSPRKKREKEKEEKPLAEQQSTTKDVGKTNSSSTTAPSTPDAVSKRASSSTKPRKSKSGPSVNAVPTIATTTTTSEGPMQGATSQGVAEATKDSSGSNATAPQSPNTLTVVTTNPTTSTSSTNIPITAANEPSTATANVLVKEDSKRKKKQEIAERKDRRATLQGPLDWTPTERQAMKDATEKPTKGESRRTKAASVHLKSPVTDKDPGENEKALAPKELQPTSPKSDHIKETDKDKRNSNKSLIRKATISLGWGSDKEVKEGGKDSPKRVKSKEGTDSKKNAKKESELQKKNSKKDLVKEAKAESKPSIETITNSAPKDATKATQAEPTTTNANVTYTNVAKTERELNAEKIMAFKRQQQLREQQNS